jgi:pyrroline-5-carboxylate reductase
MVDAINFNSYRVRSAAQTLSLHMGPARAHATIVALSSRAESVQQQQQQPWQTLRQQVGSPGGVETVFLVCVG